MKFSNILPAFILSVWALQAQATVPVLNGCSVFDRSGQLRETYRIETMRDEATQKITSMTVVREMYDNDFLIYKKGTNELVGDVVHLPIPAFPSFEKWKESCQESIFHTCDRDEYLHAVAMARIVLGPTMHVQAPPNLSDPAQQLRLLDAGIGDWGGVSPVTPDHVNPERPWPAIDLLAERTAERGFRLRERRSCTKSTARTTTFAWPMKTIWRPASTSRSAWRCTFDTSGQVASR